MHERGNLSPRQACAEIPPEQVLEMGRAVAKSLEMKAIAGMTSTFDPDSARTLADLIRLGVDVEARMAERHAVLKAEIMANAELRLLVDKVVHAERRARAEESSARVSLWFCAFLASVTICDAARAAAALIRGAF